MKYLFTFIFLLLVTGCVIQFIPEIEEEKKLLVVEGLITDQYRTNKVKISYSLSLGKRMVPVPVKGCDVTIIDNHGIRYELKESPSGTYTTDSTIFCGHVNDSYTLSISTGSRTYVSYPMKMETVPPIDSVYYEKVLIRVNENGLPVEGCRIYIDSHDPSKECLFYRWDFCETWEFHIPYSVPNYKCWKSNNSDKIYIKNTSIYNQARVTKFPIQYISDETDRLKVKYSILVNQYSLNEDEFNYWEKVKNVSENVGGLYDVTPMAVPSNIYCLEDADETVLGYFSVSAVTQERIFIKGNFKGIPNFYSYCPGDTIRKSGPIEGEGIYVWVIEDHSYDMMNPYRIITYYRECADCTVDGTNIKPAFWE